MTDLFPGAVITGEMLPFLQLPPGIGRYDLVEGRIAPLLPLTTAHAETVVRVGALLLDRMPGYRILAPCDPGLLVRSKPDTVRSADVLAISESRLQQSEPARMYLTVPPELVVEVVVPRQVAEDIDEKVAEYLAIGVDAVWIVDVDAGTLTTYRRPLRPPQVYAQRGTSLALPNGANVFLYEILGA